MDASSVHPLVLQPMTHVIYSIHLITEPLSCCSETLKQIGRVAHFPKHMELLVNYSMAHFQFITLSSQWFELVPSAPSTTFVFDRSVPRTVRN